MTPYFRERLAGAPPRTTREVSPQAWISIREFVSHLIEDNWFSKEYPLRCSDDRSDVYGLDKRSFYLAARSRVPDLLLPLPEENPPSGAIFDFLEFCYEKIAKPTEGGYHRFFNHHHLSFDRNEGKKSFRDGLDAIFRRLGIAYDFQADGQIVNVLPDEHAQVEQAHYETGDADLDALLEVARRKFLSRDFIIRCEALEKLWDAWERLKTLDGRPKPQGAAWLLDSSSGSPQEQQMLETEMRSLTEIGNRFRIRHSEVDKIPIRDAAQVEYLFVRLHALIYYFLERIGGIR